MVMRFLCHIFLGLTFAIFAAVNALRMAVLACGVYHLGRFPREISDLLFKNRCIFTPQNLDEDILLFGFIVNIPMLALALFIVYSKLKLRGNILLLSLAALLYEIAIRFTFWIQFVEYD